MLDRLCSTCTAWECAADDAYCGCCGKPCAQLTLEAIPSVLHIGQIAPNVGFRVSNPTCGALSIQQITKPGWVTMLGQPVELSPGGTAVFYGRAATFPMKEPASFQVKVETPAGTASCLLMVIAEMPRLVTTPKELVVWTSPRRTGHQRVELQFGPLAGCLRVLGVSRPALPWLTVVESPTAAVIASPSVPVPLVVDVDTALLAQMDKRSGEIAIEYDDAHGARNTMLPLQFVLRNAPVLRWTGEDKPPPILHQAAKQVIYFEFKNGAKDDPLDGRMNAPLVLESVSLHPDKAGLPISIRGASQPLVLSGGATYRMDFELNLELVEPGIHVLHLVAQTDIAELRQVRYRAAIDTRELSVFDGIIAIDFGTSNTCCAVLENGEPFESIPLDGIGTTAPTIVRYLDLKGRFPEIETGVLVKNQAARNEKAASSTVQRLKQQLGESTYPLRIRPMNSLDWVYREARLAARDYLHHIRMSAERTKGATFREFILTHPAVCSIRQYRNLRSALEEAFGKDSDIHFLQEPIAALVPFFDKMAMDRAVTGYTVAAFDLGGGTTDVTVVRVTHQRDGDAVQILPEIVASWGERFGGENLTDFLVEQLQARCKEVLTHKLPGFDIADYPISGASTSDILRNRAALRQWAESFKASLSEEKSSAADRELLMLSTISTSPDQPPLDQDFSDAELGAGSSGILRQVFLAHAKAQIIRIADRLKQSSAGMPPLNCIYLSGKTTFLPIVRETLRAIFPAVILRADDPKECVVRGACLSRSMAGSHLRRLVLPPESQRTTSRIGLMDEDTGRFREFLPLDRPIPPSGLTREGPNVWNGRDVIVIWENLGVEDSRVNHDGTRNKYLQKYGTWEPERLVEIRSGPWWALRLTLTPKFTLEVAAVGPSGQTVPFRLRGAGGS